MQQTKIDVLIMTKQGRVMPREIEVFTLTGGIYKNGGIYVINTLQTTVEYNGHQLGKGLDGMNGITHLTGKASTE